VRRFLRRFPDRVGVLHSELSPGERFDTWRLARAGELSIVVGPRSALFTPFPDIGLIVVDECHDDSYYQGETPPHYNARREAAAYAEICGAECVMGSATPNVTSTYQAARGEWQALSLPERILAHKEAVASQIEKAGGDPAPARFTPFEEDVEMAELPPVEVVDMRQELKAGNRSIFSRPLGEQLEEVLERGQQAILFLNRRGASTYVFCRECGYALKCPHCDSPLTYHLGENTLRCHRCGYRRRMPEKCPECGSRKIKHYGTGTEEVERALIAHFPEVRTLRWDRDTTRLKGAHDRIMAAFSKHEADVLIGTQMLAKGLDLPLVTLVGVVLADMGLNFPDYRTNERTFQILTQVAGRAGRSPLGGQVILQTFQPEHFVIQAASQHDYREFYRAEIADRRELGYPPFTRLVRLETRDVEEDAAEERARALAKVLQKRMREEDYRATHMIGPVPCFFARVRGQYRWQIILRGPDPTGLLKGRAPGQEWRIEVDPPSLL
jgi:primosomal protein N' (replication factor Y)